MSKKSGNSSRTGRAYLLLVGLAVLSVVFMGATILLAIGMLPTIVAFLTDRTRERLRGMTVGFMNFAGCFPFLIDLVNGGGTKDVALGIVLQPENFIVMYMAAGMGYLIEWSVTGIVANLKVQKGERRLVAIDKRKKDLIKIWGEEVTGSVPVDEEGFPVE